MSHTRLWSLGLVLLGLRATSVTALKWNNLLAFGDSYTFVEGQMGRANFSFIGDAFEYAFSPEQLLTNEIVPNKTSSDAANWLEYLTGCFGGLPSACPTQLWDFAFAGADISKDLLPLHHNYTVDLVDQVQQWMIYAADVLNLPPRETLVVWWIGINDTGDTTDNESITDWEAFWDAEMRAYMGAVHSVIGKGYRQHLFLNVPPGERAPATLGNAAQAGRKKQRIKEYNSALKKALASFRVASGDDGGGLEMLEFDSHRWFNTVLDDAQGYGFTNTTGYCECKDSEGYFWYNSGHPTAQVHELLADAVSEFLVQGAWR
ncbi:carbohydrate esterase family 16 protein [Cylindrobasidium torrendii FP15055 ss-10]|uniref:Carbohydrate esterase family 16 protein n=1 Tax=Cylindrobasidium torrendii FP15055 ss-10 TaxID=1314674 RepID=A0A0D7BQA5_9AGAR|nr:carbohydrate esterase family 16 protein [Cylindrobasidium torrendii FP15055 ss-10]